MASISNKSIRTFLSVQVFRDDYWIITDPSTLPAHYPGQHKQERLQAICIMKGYRTPQACKDIQARLHRLRSPVPGSNQVTTGSSTLESDADTAIESSYSNRSKELNCLTLLQHYLPDCVTALPAQAAANDASNPLQIDPNAATPKPGWRLTWMNEEGYRYLLYLPPEVHALMVENDGCMLAA